MAKKKSNNYTCNICGTESGVLGIKRGVRAIRCPSCGFIWKDVKSFPDDYRKMWEYGSCKGDAVRNSDNVHDYRLKTIFGKSRLEVKKIMDFGCGRGEFVRHLRSKGYEAYGCDLGKHIPDASFFFNKDIRDVQEYDFDAIVSIETFEHIEDIKTTVIELVKRLKKDGMLYVQTNFTHIDSVLGWGYFDLANHISFYSPKSMNKLMDNAGMDLVYLDDKNLPKDLLWFMRKLVHVSHKIIPYSMQKLKLSRSAAHFGMKTAKRILGKKVTAEPYKDYISGLLEISNCVFVGVKR